MSIKNDNIDFQWKCQVIHECYPFLNYYKIIKS